MFSNSARFKDTHTQCVSWDNLIPGCNNQPVQTLLPPSMGISYHHFQVFALLFVPRTVSKPELETFLAAHPEYRWDTHKKILYPAATYRCFWSDRLNGWKRSRSEPEWVEEDDEVPFLGMLSIPTPDKSPEPDFEAAQEAFGDRLLVFGWVEVGYTC